MSAQEHGPADEYDTDSEDYDPRDDLDWDEREVMSGFALPDPDDTETFSTAGLIHRSLSPTWIETAENKDEEGNLLLW